MRASRMVRAMAVATLMGGAAALVRADEGMWLFNRPPLEDLKAKYGFEPDQGWFDRLQRACVRISTGGSGSIVSPRGLVMTNHHVGADILLKLSSAERNLIQDGFLARTAEEELPCPDLEMLVLWTIQDVTDQVQRPAQGLDAAEAEAARRKAMSALEAEAGERTGLHCEVVPLYQGGRYHLYCYKRYTEIKLVMAPAEDVAAFGGDVDNFEFPRWCLDMTFFRIYEDGRPLQPDAWLPFSKQGASEGDLVFVAGHPGSTQRLYTMAHLEFLRDVRTPTVLELLWRSEVKLKTFAEDDPEQARVARGELAGVMNARKAYTGIQKGLMDPALWGAKAEAETLLRKKVESLPTAEAKWGQAWEKIAAAEQVAAEMYPRYSAIGGRGLGIGSDVLGFAVQLVRMADELGKPGPERLREYRETNLPAVRMGLTADVPLHEDFQVHQLESGLLRMAETLGADDPLVLRALDGMAPRARAEALVRGTSLMDAAERERLVEGGPEAIRASEDPLLAFVRELDPAARELRKRWEDEVESVEREAYADIAAARFAILGEGVYPDATFTLRFSYGVVKGYTESGKRVEPFTTIAGMYERADARDEEFFDLPALWLERKGELDLSTPYNFVSTNDIIGGNSGSPVVDREGQVVGLIFDGNIHSLASNVAYSDDPSRAVSVDVRAIRESLRAVYKAERLLEELDAEPAEAAEASAGGD